MMRKEHKNLLGAFGLSLSEALALSLALPVAAVPTSVSMAIAPAAMCSAPTVPVVSPATSWSQNDPKWKRRSYDHANGPHNHIGEQGCLLTSLAYAMSAAGQTFTPVTLNTELKKYRGDYSASDDATPDDGGEISPVPAVTTASRSGLKLDVTNSNASTTDALDAHLCAPTPRPVIVQVRGSSGDPHYVVVTGKTSNTYSILDPGSFHNPRTSLSQYGNNFIVVGVVKPVVGRDPSVLSLSVLNNATLLVTAPDGSQTGVNPSTGETLKGSPQSAYFSVSNAVDNDEESLPPTETMHSVELYLPADGAYMVQVQGLKLGLYKLTMQTLDANGKVQSYVVTPGVANVRSNSTFVVNFLAASGAQSTVSSNATFDSAIADVTNSNKIGLIDGSPVTESLTALLEVAQGASYRHDRLSDHLERAALDVFTQVVIAENGRKITGAASQVLHNDAASLISQIPVERKR
jgi:hypothetical protein